MSAVSPSQPFGALYVVARAIAEAMWSRRRSIGAPTGRYGPTPSWPDITQDDRDAYAAIARGVLADVRGAGRGLTDDVVVMLFAQSLYRHVWRRITADGDQHPTMGRSPLWSGEIPETRADYVVMSRAAIAAVRSQRGGA